MHRTNKGTWFWGFDTSLSRVTFHDNVRLIFVFILGCILDICWFAFRELFERSRLRGGPGLIRTRRPGYIFNCLFDSFRIDVFVYLFHLVLRFQLDSSAEGWFGAEGSLQMKRMIVYWWEKRLSHTRLEAWRPGEFYQKVHLYIWICKYMYF